MPPCVSDVSSLDDLRAFIERTICEREYLVLGAFEFDEQVLERRGKPCGLHFRLSGPRSVQFSAIWDAIRRTILFYDSTGKRFRQTNLTDSVQLNLELADTAHDTACN